MRVTALDVREVAAEQLIAVLASELRFAVQPRHAGEIGQLAEVLRRIGDGDEPAAGRQHSRKLAQRAVDVGHVVEHPCGDRHVELALRERKLLHVADSRVQTLAALVLDHPLRLVDPHELGAELVHDPLGELASPPPTSSTRLGFASATAANSTSRASGPSAVAYAALRAARLASVAYWSRTNSASSSRATSVASPLRPSARSPPRRRSPRGSSPAR